LEANIGIWQSFSIFFFLFPDFWGLKTPKSNDSLEFFIFHFGKILAGKEKA
jgi:hypothetical protein